MMEQDGFKAGEENSDRARHKEMKDHLADFALEGNLATDPVEKLSDGEVCAVLRVKCCGYGVAKCLFVVHPPFPPPDCYL